MGFLSLKSEVVRAKREALWALLLILAVCALFYFIYHRRANPDYAGRIIERWADYSQTAQGSQPYFRLLVESDDGRHFEARVDSSTYEKARVGMRIRSQQGQITLIDSEKK